jgi:hypothetical protein
MKPIIIFNGAHSSGKSTLARMLCEKHKLPFFHEIGYEVLKSFHYVPTPELDPTIMQKELERDNGLLSIPSVPVVETWHPGNMAYAYIRNKKAYGKYLQGFEKTLKNFSPIAVNITITETTFKTRYNGNYFNMEFDEIIEFYKEIKKITLKTYRDFKIPYITIVNDNSLEESYQYMVTQLKNETPLSLRAL